MNIILATDHAGFERKETIKQFLLSCEMPVEDVGAHTLDANDDYPEYMRKAAQLVQQSPTDTVAIIFGGSGQGEAIVANRHSGVRAIVYAHHNPKIATLGREHNNANVLSIGARFVSDEEAIEAVQVFLDTHFTEDDRHRRRIDQIDN